MARRAGLLLSNRLRGPWGHEGVSHGMPGGLVPVECGAGGCSSGMRSLTMRWAGGCLIAALVIFSWLPLQLLYRGWALHVPQLAPPLLAFPKQADVCGTTSWCAEKMINSINPTRKGVPISRSTNGFRAKGIVYIQTQRFLYMGRFIIE